MKILIVSFIISGKSRVSEKMMIIKNLVRRCSFYFRFSNRKIIQPQEFTSQKVEEYFLVRSRTYQFLIDHLPQKHQIYRHQIETPASVLKKPGIHILPKQIPQLNRREKFTAVNRKVHELFEKSFRNCKLPQQFFHMNRKVNTEIRKRLSFVGTVEEKYKHYMLFQPYQDRLKAKTRQEYMKKGVKVDCLGGVIIYPKGQVWMPTNQKYLIDFVDTLKRMQGDKSVKDVLDIGCGSGVLSFLCKKSFKKARIIGFDTNQAAVDTTNINAAEHRFDDVTAYMFDIRKVSEFKQKLKQQKLGNLYDLIVINPPWLQAKKLPNQSDLQGGVYDQNGQMLQSSLKTASKHLRDANSKILLIYSDLNKNLNLQKKSIQQLCKQNQLLIHTLKERQLTYNLEKPSPLNQFKLKSKIQLYQIRKS